MDTGATNHVHNNQDISNFRHDNVASHHVLVSVGSKIHVIATSHTFFLLKILILPFISVISSLPPLLLKILYPYVNSLIIINVPLNLMNLVLLDLLYLVLPQFPQVLVSTNSTVWHQRLRHPRNHVMQFLHFGNCLPCNNYHKHYLSSMSTWQTCQTSI